MFEKPKFFKTESKFRKTNAQPYLGGVLARAVACMRRVVVSVPCLGECSRKEKLRAPRGGGG
jgi:hypothetical protein